MRKTVQIAFAIALISLSIIASIWKTELISNIIYAIVIPSFILSVISMVNDLSEKCKEDAKRIRDSSAQEVIQVEKALSDEYRHHMKDQNKSALGDALHEEYIKDLHRKGTTYREAKYIAEEIQTFCSAGQNICEKICIVGYVLLFLCLSLSPYITKWLSAIDLNCISLWSLTFLYFSLEVKSSICDLIYKTLSKRYLRKFHSIENG